MAKKKRLNRIRCSKCNRIVGHDSVIKIIEKCPSCHSGKPKKKRTNTLSGSFSKTKKGRLMDLPKEYQNYSFRSGWEMNFARVLVAQKKEWTYERMSFTFTQNPKTNKPYTRKPWVYIPDFYEVEADTLWEVKGYLRPADRSKMKRFKVNYPEDFKKLKACLSKSNKSAIAFYKHLGVPMVYYETLKAEWADKVNWE